MANLGGQLQYVGSATPFSAFGATVDVGSVEFLSPHSALSGSRVPVYGQNQPGADDLSLEAIIGTSLLNNHNAFLNFSLSRVLAH